MKALSTVAGFMIGRPCRSLVALLLCPVLLAGCAGAGLQSSGLAGPSWQQREALHLQEEEEGDDLGDRLRKAEEQGEAKRKRRAWLVIVACAALLGVALSSYLQESDDDDLTYDAPFPTDSSMDEKLLRYGGMAQY